MKLSVCESYISNEHCASCAANHLGLCGLLDHTSFSLLSERSQQAHYTKGDEIALQGEQSDRIGIISAGLVKVVLMTEDGEHHVLQLLKPGQFVGDPCRSENVFSWEAAVSADVCWINRQALDKLMQDHPDIHQAYLDVTSQQLEAHRLWAASMRGRNTLQRTAFWIVQQLNKAADGGTENIRIGLSRRDLASLLDMTAETLCRSLYQLIDRGAITLVSPDEINVQNFPKLRMFARCGESRVNESLNSQVEAKDNPFCIAQNPKRGRASLIKAKSRQNDLSSAKNRYV